MVVPRFPRLVLTALLLQGIDGANLALGRNIHGRQIQPAQPAIPVACLDVCAPFNIAMAPCPDGPDFPVACMCLAPAHEAMVTCWDCAMFIDDSPSLTKSMQISVQWIEHICLDAGSPVPALTLTPRPIASAPTQSQIASQTNTTPHTSLASSSTPPPHTTSPTPPTTSPPSSPSPRSTPAPTTGSSTPTPTKSTTTTPSTKITAIPTSTGHASPDSTPSTSGDGANESLRNVTIEVTVTASPPISFSAGSQVETTIAPSPPAAVTGATGQTSGAGGSCLEAPMFAAVLALVASLLA